MEVLLSTMPHSVVSETAAVDRPESSALPPAVSAMVGEKATYGYHILVGRAVSCSEKTCVEKRAMTGASTQTNQDALANDNSANDNSANDNSSPGPVSKPETGKRTTIETPIQTNKDDVVDGSSHGSPASPNTLVNTPIDPSSPVDAGHNEQQKAGFEDVQEPQITNQELSD
ncbi:MAG: hypothetical protein ASARMPRED_009236 [Alectoria sarmentosa]|nr:MAG: hypothetical protein ASARMPRED_009236 [Alectoria sarmentosa]